MLALILSTILSSPPVPAARPPTPAIVMNDRSDPGQMSRPQDSDAGGNRQDGGVSSLGPSDRPFRAVAGGDDSNGDQQTDFKFRGDPFNTYKQDL